TVACHIVIIQINYNVKVLILFIRSRRKSNYLKSNFCFMLRNQQTSTLFPYTTLFRSRSCSTLSGCSSSASGSCTSHHSFLWHWRDRKSTRLNSSHVEKSYAVFCLKKKKVAVGGKRTSERDNIVPC